MSSRFVSAGSDQELNSANDDWTKAKQEVDSARAGKQIPSGKQDDGKTLYEALQANKLAKQEAFEEAAKLSNQFRALDDSEVEFLESVQQAARSKEAAAKKETAEQLELFRKQRAVAEQAALAEAQRSTRGDDNGASTTVGSWTITKKRKRMDHTNGGVHAPRLKEQTITTKVEEKPMVKPLDSPETSSADNGTEVVRSIRTRTTQELPSVSNTKTASIGLGLSAYDSDDD